MYHSVSTRIFSNTGHQTLLILPSSIVDFHVPNLIREVTVRLEEMTASQRFEFCGKPKRVLF